MDDEDIIGTLQQAYSIAPLDLVKYFQRVLNLVQYYPVTEPYAQLIQSLTIHAMLSDEKEGRMPRTFVFPCPDTGLDRHR